MGTLWEHYSFLVGHGFRFHWGQTIQYGISIVSWAGFDVGASGGWSRPPPCGSAGGGAPSLSQTVAWSG